LFAEYSASPESRAKYHSAVHAAARWVRDAAFTEALADPNAPKRVIFTSGGSAAGKTTLAPALMTGSDALVYDSTLSVISGAQVVIEAALAAGKAVTVVHIRRQLDDAFKANLHRAIQAGGRTTAIRAMVRTHRGADDVFMALATQYQSDARIQLEAFENPGGPLLAVPVDSLRVREFDGAEERLRCELESRRESLPRYVYEAAVGRLIAGIFPVCKE
jgi:hypothetical protein